MSLRGVVCFNCEFGESHGVMGIGRGAAAGLRYVMPGDRAGTHGS